MKNFSKNNSIKYNIKLIVKEKLLITDDSFCNARQNEIYCSEELKSF